ncbi:MAG TPA: 16S rRNA (cytosine(1402)-N(4))-methyltransferase RsmH [Actinomycetota bacterium]|nr:16S rRNA (cytosine(1402)-N(4))-methyltransferase RsmH [Actinomycetota bacterium]
MEHEPVLAREVVELLRPALDGGGVVVDGTLGRGGHARALLDAAPRASLVGIDRDPDALEESRSRLAAYSDRIRLVRDDFTNLASVLERLGAAPVRGVLLDLGVSSPQLDDARRGFGYRAGGPLDMRMDPEQRLSADDVVNRYEGPALERVIRTYGEERFARRVTRAIVAARPVRDTAHLADVVRDAIPAATRRTGPHPARRTFQAIRIEVNDELGALERALPHAVDALEPGGRAVVVSYHSLEDRIVKRFFAREADGCVCPPDFPVCSCGAHARVRVVTRRPVRPGAHEVARNPRASSARLRAAERLRVEAPEARP